MNALEQNHFTSAWRDFGTRVGRPRAVLVISAHWYSNSRSTRSNHSNTTSTSGAVPNPQTVPTDETNL